MSDLAELIAIRSESQELRGHEHLQHYVEHSMVPLLSNMGFTCTILPNPVVGAGPFLLAERVENTDLPTILTYGHGDVVRGQDDQWQDGLSPFVLTEIGERLYGRGTADAEIGVESGQFLVIDGPPLIFESFQQIIAVRHMFETT